MNNLIAVTIGDIKGIGIEILLKTWKSKKIKNFILFTNEKYFRYYLKKNNIKIKYKVINNISIKLLNLYKNEFLIYTYNAINNSDNTYKSLKYAYEFTKLKKSIGIITLPLNKNIIIKNIDKKFQGQTEFFQKCSVMQSFFQKFSVMQDLLQNCFRFCRKFNRSSCRICHHK